MTTRTALLSATSACLARRRLLAGRSPLRDFAGGHACSGTSSFLVGGKPVRVHHFEPDRSGKHPAVLLPHGSAGLPKQDADASHHIAGVLAQKGYVARLVHHFDGTGTNRIDHKGIDEKLFRAWMGVVQGAV
jgi:hypothetical protein